MDFSAYGLTPVEDMDCCPFPFFDDEPKESELPAEAWYKIYNDGGHFVATRILRNKGKHISKNKPQEDIDICFDSLYTAALRKGLKDTKCEKAMTDYITAGMLKLFADYPDLDEYISDHMKRKRHNLYIRKKRFRRKAYLNKWNYFLTFTFDSDKHSAETFRKKLRKCLSNLHTRRGWRYMGVFEYSPEKERLHFHALAYIPDGEMLGKVEEKHSYSPKTGKVETRNENSFFADSFGVNDFTEINEMALKHGHTIDYLLKYIEKQGERIVYSRGIATEVCKKLTAREIITNFTDYVEKFVLFDNALNWERDIMHYKYRQMTMIDFICNPPRVA